MHALRAVRLNDELTFAFFCFLRVSAEQEPLAAPARLKPEPQATVLFSGVKGQATEVRLRALDPPKQHRSVSITFSADLKSLGLRISLRR